MLTEKVELDSKIEKLHRFMLTTQFENLPQAEKDCLERQHIVMCQYSGILGERINGFTSA